MPARVVGYQASDLDTLIGAGEVVWCGVEPIGETDGRIALYLADNIAELHTPAVTKLQTDPSENPLGEKQQQILELLASRGAMFFGALHEAVGGGFPGETIDALWGLVWAGRVTNDTFHALRAYMAKRVRCEVLRGSMCNRIFDHAARWRRVRRVDGHWSILQIQLKYHRPFEATRLRYSC